MAAWGCSRNQVFWRRFDEFSSQGQWWVLKTAGALWTKCAQFIYQGKTFKVIITNTRSFRVWNKGASCDVLYKPRRQKCRMFLIIWDSLSLSSPGWPSTHESDFAFTGIADVCNHTSSEPRIDSNPHIPQVLQHLASLFFKYLVTRLNKLLGEN